MGDRAATESLYCKVLERVSDGVVSLNSDLEYTYANQRAEELLDTTTEALLGKTVWEAIPDVRGTVAERKFERAVETGEPQTFERHNQDLDRWFEVRIYPDDDGVSVFFTDITERKEHKRQLQRTSAFLKQTQEVADVGGWEVDLRTGALRWTDQVYRIHGLPLSYDPQVDEVFERYHPEDRDTIEAAYDRLVTEGDAYDLELRIVTTDDEVRWVRTRGQPRYEDGEVVAAQGTFQDITRTKEHELALEQLQQRTQQLMQTDTVDETAQVVVEAAHEVVGAPLSGFHLLTDGGDALAGVASVNMVREELGGAPTYDRTAESDPVAEFVWEVFESGTARTIADTQTYEPLAGETPVRSAIVHPIANHGVFVVSAMEPDAFDGTDEALVEVLAASLTAALDRVENEQEIKRQNQRLDEFAGIVSHDLRGPLTVARGRVELARAECDSDHLAEVVNAHDRMDALIDDLLTVSREGGTVSEITAVDLQRVVNECWQVVGGLEATLRTDLQHAVRADEPRLRQLIENLLRNAVEHGGDDVTVTVGTLDDGFYVADDGPGIPAEERHHVFDPGYSTSSDGTGYGLNIVGEIADAHGWDVRVTESESGGTRFEITGITVAES